MDGNTTWDLLRLALTGLTLAFSILIWYAKHFIDTLKEAESQASGDPPRLGKSGGIFVIGLGTACVLVATWLSGKVAYDAIRTSAVRIPYPSNGWFLLVMCLVGPGLGAILVFLVAMNRNGWTRGLLRSWRWLVTERTRVVDFYVPSHILEAGLTGDFLPDITTREAWKRSLDWVRSNERRWRLGRGFLEKHGPALASLANSSWQLLKATSKGMSNEDVFEHFEIALADVIQKSLASSGNVDAQILNRPRQLARAACVIHLEKRPRSKTSSRLEAIQ